ncbi:hypothetical protein D3C84_754740 [compost metagenome]
MGNHRPMVTLEGFQAFQKVMEQRVARVGTIQVPLRLDARWRHREGFVYAQKVRDIWVIVERLAPAFVFVDPELVDQHFRHAVRVRNHHVGTHQ